MGVSPMGFVGDSNLARFARAPGNVPGLYRRPLLRQPHLPTLAPKRLEAAQGAQIRPPPNARTGMAKPKAGSGARCAAPGPRSRRFWHNEPQLMRNALLIIVATVALLTAGCHRQPGYVGSFRIALSDAQQKKIDDSLAQMPEKQRAQMKTVLDAVAKVTLTVNADGTWKISGIPNVKDDAAGTYKADGDVLTMTANSGTTSGMAPEKLEYDAATHALIANKGDPNREMSFKKL
jgi:hypothetical protein